ncbi:hypothetical protein [Pseudomonas sp. Marseille-Q8238]
MADPSVLPRWLNLAQLTTDPEQLAGIDQFALLNGLREWSQLYLGQHLTNDIVAELALVPRNTVEAWRTRPDGGSHREMPVHRRLLLVYRLREQFTVRRKKWTPEEKAYIRNNYPATSIEQLACELGRTALAVLMQLSALGATNDKRIPFSDDELAYIRTHAATQTAAQIAEHLQRHPYSIRAKIRKLGIDTKGHKRSRFTSAEVEFIRSNASTMTAREIATSLRRDPSTIRHKVLELGLELKRKNKRRQRLETPNEKAPH